MERARWVGSIVVLSLIAGVAAASAQTMTPPTLRADLETCETDAMPAKRVASFVGSMPAIDGADRMRMRFDLMRRRPNERHWRRVKGVRGFGRWHTSMTGRAGFVYHKRIDGLQVPASYRAIVRFRWDSEDGTVVRRARRRTPTCTQPDKRADLEPRSLRATFGAEPVLAIYRLVVRNSGLAAAGPFTVTVAGVPREVEGLDAGEETEVVVVAAPCLSGSRVRAVVDADRRIDESDEHNSLRRTCPLRR